MAFDRTTLRLNLKINIIFYACVSTLAEEFASKFIIVPKLYGIVSTLRIILS